MPPINLNSLPDDASALRKMVGELAAQLQHESAEKDKYRSLLRELLEAQRNRKSEQLSKEQLGLFEELWKAQQAEDESEESELDAGGDAPGDEGAQTPRTKRASVRRPLASHLVRERIVHDLAEAEKRCQECGKDLRLIGEDKSERYEYVPATMKVIEDVRLRYACDCTVKAAEKPAQPIEKSTAGASLLAQVVVSKFCDHQPLHRQEQMFARHGVEISRQTMCGWMAAVAGLTMPRMRRPRRCCLTRR